MIRSHTVSRRRLLRAAATSSAIAAGAALLAACGGTASVSGGTSSASVSAQASAALTTTSSTAATTSQSVASAATTVSLSPSSAATAATATSSAAATTAAAASTTASASAAATSAPAAKAGTLTYLSPDTQGRHDAEAAIYADFTKANPAINIEILSGAASWTDVEAKLKTSIAGGSPVNFYENGWGSWADVQSVLTDFSPLMSRDKLDPTKLFALPALDTFTDQGKLWALPLVGVSQDALAYNLDLFDAAGLTPPPVDPTDNSWTMDKFLEYAQKLTKPDQLQFGYGGSNGGFDTGGVTRGTFFGTGPWDDTAHKSNMDQPGAAQGLQYFKDLRDKYKVQPTSQQVQSIGAPKGQDVFTSGKIGMQVIYGYVLKQTFRWGLAALPHTGSENVSGRQYAQPYQVTKTPQTEQTWTLMKWLMQTDNAARLPMTANYAVSPVNGASDLAQKAYQDKVGVDPKAFVLMSQHSHVSAWGMLKYAGWSKVNTWLGDNFKNFDSGQQSASDYGKAAADYINSNLMS